MSYVYLIQQGRDGPVKIGTSVAPYLRMRSLQTSNPTALRMLAILEGGRDLEKSLHDWLRSYRLHGEWYRPTATVLREFGYDEKRAIAISREYMDRHERSLSRP